MKKVIIGGVLLLILAYVAIFIYNVIGGLSF